MRELHSTNTKAKGKEEEGVGADNEEEDDGGTSHGRY